MLFIVFDVVDINIVLVFFRLIIFVKFVYVVNFVMFIVFKNSWLGSGILGSRVKLLLLLMCMVC